MAKKKQVNKVKLNDDLVKKVDSLVDEIERTNNFQKIDEDEIESLEETFEMKKVEEEKEVGKEQDDALKEESTNEEEKLEKKKEDTSDSEKEIVKEKVEDKKETKKKENLDKTNFYDFEFDNNRLSELDSLDTSFLEGRIKSNPSASKYIYNNKKLKKANIKRNKPIKTTKNSKKKVVSNTNITKGTNYNRSILSRVIFTLIITLFIGSLFGFMYCYKFVKKTEIVVETKTVIKEKKVVDDNYLFLGDSITYFYDLEKYYEGLPVIKSGICGNTTEDILDDMTERVYKYNPSKIFLLIGTNDYIFGGNNDSIIENLTKIIDEINENRPYADIYIESVYPINKSDDKKIDLGMVKTRENEDIIELNKRIKKLAKDKRLTYIDMFSILYDSEKEELKLDYTEEGLHISDEGYEVITKELMKYIKA